MNDEIRLGLCSDKQKVEDFLVNEGPKKPAQALTIMKIQSAGEVPFTATQIKAMAGVTDSTVEALLALGLLEEFDYRQNARAIHLSLGGSVDAVMTDAEAKAVCDQYEELRAMVRSIPSANGPRPKREGGSRLQCDGDVRPAVLVGL